MKKVLVFIVLLLFPFFVYAEEYEIEEVNLKMSIDDDWYVFTRNNIRDNETLKELGVDPDELYNLFLMGDMYIDAMAKDFNKEFYLCVYKDRGINNLSNYPDDMIETNFISEIKEEYSQDTSNLSVKLSKINNQKYVELVYYDLSAEQYILMYYTIINANGYSFNISKNSKITNDDKELLKKMIETSDVKLDSKYKQESYVNQEKINQFSNRTKNSIIRIVIYVIIGIIGVIVVKFTNKKKDDSNMNNVNNINNNFNNNYTYSGVNNNDYNGMNNNNNNQQL